MQGAHLARYPAVELLTALLYLAVTWRDGLTPALPFDLIFVSALVALIFIDAEHMLLPNAITYPGMVFALVARVLIPYLTATPHFDDLEPLMRGHAPRNADVGGVADWRGDWRTDWRRLVVADGLDLGEAARHRSDGPGRREDDVYGRSLSRLAADHSYDLSRRAVGLASSGWLDGAPGKTKHADAFALRRLSWNRRHRGIACRFANCHVVCGTISLISIWDLKSEI